MKRICYSMIIFSMAACIFLSFGCSKSGRRPVVNNQGNGSDTSKSTEDKTLKAPTPEPNQSSVSSPINGTNLIQPKGPSGRGTLKVTNGTSHDAVVRLADESSKKTRRLVYVRANSEFTIEGIGVSKCLLQFSTGTDWDKSKRKFLRDKSYLQFDNLLEFKETKTDLGIKWTTFEVTLHAVLDGNAHTTPIDESDFEDEGNAD